MRKRQNGEFNVRNFRCFFFGMSSDVPAFKVRVFAGYFDFEMEYMNISSRQSNSNFCSLYLLSNDPSSRCKLKVCIITHTKEKPSTTN